MEKQHKGRHTLCIHEGEIHDDQFGGAISPIFMATAYPFIDTNEKRYPRYFNTPNQEVIGRKLAALENAEAALPFSSGMAAISTCLLSLLKSGDHVVFQNEIYGGTFNLVLTEFNELGIEYSFTDGVDPGDFKDCIRENTRMIYLETPSNPLLSITDLDGIAKLAKANNLLTVIDNTFASPINQRPLDFGIDLVVHSATKYLGGHSDITAGIVAGKRAHLDVIMKKARNLGGNLSDFTCFLLERSIKTLGIRIERHNENAMYLALALQELEGISKVFYPGLENHKNHEVAVSQMNGFGGMLSFVLDRSLNAKEFQNRLKMIKPAMSLAGVESTIIQPSLTSHSLMSAEERKRQGIDDNLLRLSVGIENKEDILQDILQALNHK